MMINELQRKISTRDMRAGQGPALLSRLGIPLTPNKGGLACQCDPRGDCTCRIATRDAKRPGIGHPHLIAAVLALRNISDRLDAVEQQHAANQASQGMAQPKQPHAVIAAAKAKADDFLAARYSEKVDQSILESHQKRAEEAYRQAHGDPDAPQFQQRTDIDMDAHKHGAPLDESSGDNRQATTQHPLGKSRMTSDGSEYITPEQARQLFKQRDAEQAARRRAFEHEAVQNRAFNDQQHAMVRSIQEINDRYNIARYGSR
jgi:hypothetical protein